MDDHSGSNHHDADLQPFSTLHLNISTSASTINKYPAKSHARRVADTLSAPGLALIVAAATPARLWPDSDMPMPFRQARYFYYLSGCNEPGCWIAYDLRADRLTLFLPPIDESRVVWTGRGSTVEEAMEKYDIDEARYLQDDDPLADAFPSGLAGAYDDVFILHPDRERHASLARTLARTGLTRDWHHSALKHALDACRVIKDPYEIACIRRANVITAAAHTAVFARLSRCTNEAEVEAAYTSVCIARHAKDQAYAPIAGSGPNAAVLHYGANDEDFGDREMLVLDAGCEVECYASDVTRTLPLNRPHAGRWPSREAEAVYRLVERVQEACIRAIGPGRPFTEIVALARRMTVEGLLALGVLKGDAEEIGRRGTVMGFFPHGLGHHVGLEVHDVSPVPHPPASGAAEAAGSGEEVWRPRSMDRTPRFPPHFDFQSTAGSASLYSSAASSVLQPGMVVTIEPGVYFNRFLLEQFFLHSPEHSPYIDTEVLERYWRVGGVRIEDDILVTEEGYENLTTAAKGDEMLEVIRKGAAKGTC